MLKLLIILFTVLPALELIVLIKVGTIIGAFNTFLIIIATGVGGAYLAKIQGLLVVQKIQNELNRGNLPTEEMLNGLMIFAGGILLLTPGFITDVTGIFLLLPPTRALIKIFILQKMKKAINNGQIVTLYSNPNFFRRNRGRFKPNKNDSNDDIEDADFSDG